MMEEFGIDIPKFANEAGFLRGKGNIIDTRTYYPNIPLFQFWMYMHSYFDGKIEAAKKGQPNCPTMILELQVGWFAQFGRPLYTAPVHLTESVSKSVVALGASLLNYYMYVGGTTFPFWGCRGNIWDIHAARHRHGHDVRLRRLAGPRVGRADARAASISSAGSRAVHARLQGRSCSSPTTATT